MQGEFLGVFRDLAAADQFGETHCRGHRRRTVSRAGTVDDPTICRLDEPLSSEPQLADGQTHVIA
jgi:hypothetical protein